jgi:hypothetical protein
MHFADSYLSDNVAIAAAADWRLLVAALAPAA